MTDPTRSLPLFAKQNRRDFLKGAAGASLGLVLGGCSGGGGGTAASGSGTPAAGGGGGGGTGGGSTPVAGTPVLGVLDTSQIGGRGLSVLSPLQMDAFPGPGGSFETSVAADSAHVLFVRDESGAIRGMALTIPGAGLTIDAASTALALVFLTPGIGTVDPATATVRVQQIQAAPSFGALVAALAALLSGADLPTAVADPGVKALLEAVAGEIPAARVSTLAARTVPFSELEAFQDQPGGLKILRDPEVDRPNAKFDLHNRGYRYVSVVRQALNLKGEVVATARPDLLGSPFVSVVSSVMGGINGLSVGNLVFGQVDSPAEVTDQYGIAPSVFPVDRTRYFFQGLGLSSHSDSFADDSVPEEVRDAFNVNVGGVSLSHLCDGFTFVYYVLFPFLEPVLGVVKLGTKTFDQVINMFGAAGVATAGAATQQGANTGNPQNFMSPMLDTVVGLMTGGGQALIELLAADAAVVTGGAAVTFASIFSLAVGAALLAMSVTNFLKAALYYGAGVPRTVVVDVPHPTAGLLQSLGNLDQVTPLGVSGKGSTVYSFKDAQGDSILQFLPLGGAPATLSGQICKAAINDTDLVLHQQEDFSTAAFLRRADGPPGALLTPPGSSLPNAQGDLSVSPDSRFAAAAWKRPSERPNVPFTDFYTFDRSSGSTLSAGLLEALGSSVDIYTYPSGGLSDSRFYANLVLSPSGGRKTWLLCTMDLATRTWSIQQETNPVSGANPGLDFEYGFVDVNSKDEALITRFYCEGDLFVGLTFVRESFVSDPEGNSRPILRTSEPPVENGPRVRDKHFVFAINEQGDVLGMLEQGTADDQTDRLQGVVWSATGTMSSIASLLPAGAPAGGVWLPVQSRHAMGGRFVLLEHHGDKDAQGQRTKSAYLWYRGATLDDLILH